MDRLNAYDAALGLVPWTAYTAYISASATAWNVAAPGSTVSLARYCRIGKTVFVRGAGSTTTLITDACASLPQGAGLVPNGRHLLTGSLLVTLGTGGAPSDQTGLARMNADEKRVVVFSDTGGFRDMPAGSSLHWHIWYEVL